MEATDLMIGDWVRVKKGHLDYGKVCEIAMDEKMQWNISFACGMNLFCAYEFEPVPITREILEKNGWECKGDYMIKNIGMFINFSTLSDFVDLMYLQISLKSN